MLRHKLLFRALSCLEAQQIIITDLIGMPGKAKELQIGSGCCEPQGIKIRGA